MTAIYRLILKKRWYVFLGIFIITFFMNLIVWNETSQLIRNLSVLNMMQIEAKKEGFDVVYHPSMDSSQSEREPVRMQLRQQLSALASDGRAFYNKTAYLHGDRLLALNDEKILQELSENQWSSDFLNDLVLRGLTADDIAMLKQTVLLLGDELALVPFKEQYETQRAYYWDNVFFALRIGSFLLLIASALLRWLLNATWKICEEEIRVLRQIGLSTHRLSQAMTLFLYSPILVALVTFVFIVHTLFYVGLIGWDYVYLLALSGLQLLMIIYLVSHHMRGRENA